MINPEQQTLTAETAHPPAEGIETFRDAFPWKLFIAVVVIIVAGHLFSATLHERLHEAVHHVAWVTGFTMAALAGLIFCAWQLYRHRLSHEPIIPLAVGALLCGHWLALDVHHVLAGRNPWFLVVCGVAFVVVAARAAHSLRHHLEMGRSLVRKRAPEYLQAHPVRALILTVSKPSAIPQFSSAENTFPITLTQPKTASPATEPIILQGKSLADDIGAAGRWFWNWQQLLRAIQPHQRTVQRVVLVGSKESELPAARRLLAAYFPQLGDRTLTCVPPLDMENFDQILGALRTLVIEELPQAGFRPHEIAVDITGGIKIASVAGAVLTLNHAVVCQYVQTDGLNIKGTPEPFIYDFRWDPSLVID